MDEDGDGKVTIDEFVGACMKQVKVLLPNDRENEGRRGNGTHMEANAGRRWESITNLTRMLQFSSGRNISSTVGHCQRSLVKRDRRREGRRRERLF